MLNQFVEYAVNILFEEYTEGNPKILNFLKERNLQIKDIDKYHIGYIRPNNTIPKFMADNLEYYSSVELIKENRIVVQDRIIIPVKDVDGVFRMISCRDAKEYGIKHGKKSDQKYLTIKDLGIVKSQILHGYYDNLDGIRSANEILITEGNMDHLTLDIFGCNYSVAISGTSFSKHIVKLINKVSKSVDIVLGLDNDKAGKQATMKIILENIELYDRLYFIDYDEPAKDPDAYVLQFGLQRFLDCKKHIKYFLNVESMKINDRIIFLWDLMKRCKNVDEIHKYYYFVLACYPDISESFYIDLLQKRLKTFENVGNFCYNAYIHKKRIHWFIERLCALWFIIAYKRKAGRNDKFVFGNRLYEYSGFAKDITEYTQYEQLKEIGEIYEEPIFSEGILIGSKENSNYTEKLLRRVAELYLIKHAKWESEDANKTE